MSVLVFNVGSTTLKYALIDPATGQRLRQGIFDRIGQAGGDAADHLSAARLTLESLQAFDVPLIAHRIVQGADRFSAPTVVSDIVLQELATLDSMAPLHNPPARAVVEEIFRLRPEVKQVLVFDTAFFVTMPPKAYRYAIPDSMFTEHHIRRYGAHGTSHQFVTQQAIEWLSEHRRLPPSSLKIISLHLGGGASVTASIGGIAIETSMGLTPLEGLVMATRCGDIDPSVPLHLMRTLGMSVDEVDRLLNKQSGLLGLCGDVDMRTILKRRELGDPSASLAIDIYVHRLQKYIGAYFAILGGLDALVFTAGVGENSSVIRELVTANLSHLGLSIDLALNRNLAKTREPHDISAPGSAVATLVVPTDEETAIARAARSLGQP